jgi:hypothetical protein
MHDVTASGEGIFNDGSLASEFRNAPSTRNEGHVMA